MNELRNPGWRRWVSVMLLVTWAGFTSSRAPCCSAAAVQVQPNAERSVDSGSAASEPTPVEPAPRPREPLTSASAASSAELEALNPKQRFSEEKTRATVQLIQVVAAMAVAALVLVFAAAWYFYAPKAWQRPFQPTPIIKDSKPARSEAAEEFERKDRYDMEGEIGDFMKQWDPPSR